jgi:glycosyltransferase involved in cell wall biosynthesis
MDGAHVPSVVRGAELITMRLLMVVNVDWFFLSHRLPIALGAKEAGHEVHIATTLTQSRSELEKYGFVVHPLNIDRSSTGIFGLFAVLISLIRIFWSVRPDVLHLVTIKPVLLGGIAARVSPVRNVVFAISGLGHVFLVNDFLGRLKRVLVKTLYTLALGIPNKRVIFQNADDIKEIRSLISLTPKQAVLIPGSGVSLINYPATPLPDSEPVVLMASRLLWTKGVKEYILMCERLKQEGIAARFLLAGDADSGNPDSVSEADLSQWKASGSVELLGHSDRIADLMRQATVVVLPSYREGFPKVLIEAAACGRAVVTTDVPGCRDAIEDGLTGLLVPAKNVDALVHAVQRLIDDPALCASMGVAARMRAEQLFDIHQVVETHLKIYGELAEADRPAP